MNTVDLRNAQWFTSSYSNGNGECVEAARGVPGAVPVRDSKDDAGAVLTFTTHAWNTFLTTLKNDDRG
ncbi:DUF397 domain-containing protein [Streptomyces hoynatensis]|uniref:DUF397 domain-containing protein n=1 Tax=Streptomyces hoynatensis TaxID=1141874 RepID=A0A3A9YQT4_9ACTN|nr:DUF397 domain-containing protein [Streptomyces hoynatensis]RKN38333.1 DUF397 domain-containing protein [Streptomyces hoynatensis]